MLKSDIKKDVRKILIDEDMTQAEMAVKAGTSPQYANRILNSKDVVNGMFIKLVEAIGYDIEINYVKRGKIRNEHRVCEGQQQRPEPGETD